ncbi:MAG: NAD(P)-dependent oxidoreductase [Phycisphaerae bacterium]
MISEQPRRWLVTGATGKLGGHVVHQLRMLHPQDEIIAMVGRGSLSQPVTKCISVSLENPEEIAEFTKREAPSIVLHLGAISDVNTAFRNQNRTQKINVGSTAALVAAARECDARVVFTSTVMVFDGEKSFYTEADATNPLSFYGRTKVEAEQIVTTHARGTTIRLPLLYGFPTEYDPTQPPTFVQQINALREGTALTLFADEFHSPLWLRDAADALIRVGAEEAPGLFHLAGPQRLSRLDLIAQCATLLDITTPNLKKSSRKDVKFPEPRPADMSMRDDQLRARFADLPQHALSLESLQPFHADASLTAAESATVEKAATILQTGTAAQGRASRAAKRA